MSSIIRKTLGQLDDVDWRTLRTAHGTAERVPAALRELAAARDSAERKSAYWNLDNYIVLQGTIYDSACAAVPYILDILLSSESTGLRIAAYDLLIEIARGVPDPGIPATDDLRHACRGTIASGWHAYAQDLLASREGAIRRRALDLVTTLDDDVEELRSLLAAVDPGDDEEFAALVARARAET